MKIQVQISWVEMLELAKEANKFHFYLTWRKCGSSWTFEPAARRRVSPGVPKDNRASKIGVPKHNQASKLDRLKLIKISPGVRDQREWVFEVREVKSENKKLSLFFEKCKVKKKCFHSFSRSAKWNQNAFTLFREVKSEIKMLRDRDREVKILENS